MNFDAIFSNSSSDDPVEVLNEVYNLISNRPLSAKDHRSLSAKLKEYISSTCDKKVGDFMNAKFSRRLSYSYLHMKWLQYPLNPNNTTEKNQSSQLENKAILAPIANVNGYQDQDVKETIVHSIDSPDQNEIYHLCSFRRQRSTLSTVYRFYLDSTKIITNSGAHSPSTNETSSSSSSSSSMNVGGENNESSSKLLFVCRVPKGGMLQDCTIWEGESFENKNSKDKTSFVAKIIRSNSIYSLRHFSGFDNSFVSLSMSVKIRGSDKFLQINAISSLESSADLFKTVGEQRIVELLSVPIASGTHVTNGVVPAVPNGIIMKSRQPHKTIDGDGNDVHAVSFGKWSRVKGASRKNIVLECVRSVRNEWDSDNDKKPPLLQMGKVEDDSFVVDFMHVTPLQAFAMALVIFDN